MFFYLGLLFGSADNYSSIWYFYCIFLWALYDWCIECVFR